MLVLKGLVDLHRTVQLQLLQRWGVDLDYCNIEWFALEMNRDHSELPDVQAGFRKGRGNRDQIANICWIIEKASKLKKKSSSASLTMLKALNVWVRTNCRKLLKRWEYQTT